MRNVKLGLLCLSALLIAACEPATTDGGDASSSTSQARSAEEASSSLPRETANVSYTGTVHPSGISIYMEGTHRLVLDDGRFILLSSENVNLNDYIEAEVEVHGAIRPTVEGNGMIMRVESVTRVAGSSSNVDASSTDSSVAVSSAKSVASSVSSTLTSSSSAASIVSSTMGSDFEARVTAMAKDDMSVSKWTQRYCSTHIGFCFDVHKNWWYKSFGTTTNALWNVEVSSAELEMPGDGPIKVQLMSGELSGATDGQVKIANGMAVGYRAWTEGRHFEVSAPSALQQAVEMITSRIVKSS